jgi:HEAT repeat protein
MIWWTLRRLKSSNSRSREAAACELGSAGNRRAVPGLIEALADDTPQVRRAAADALGALRHPAAAEPLAKALSLAASTEHAGAQPDRDECLAIAAALGRLGSHSIAPLIQLLGAKEKETRRWSAYALGSTADPRAVEPLIGRLADPRSEVRKEAAAALGRIADPRAVESLSASLSHRDPDTRRAAAEALGASGAVSAVDALAAAAADTTEAVQVAVFAALGRIGGLKALRAVRAAIDVSNRRTVRESASAALATMPVNAVNAGERASAAVLKGDFAAALREGSESVPALLEATASRDPRRREEVARSLGSVPTPEGIKMLAKLLRDPDIGVQAASAGALENIGAPAGNELRDLLDVSDPGVQRRAAHVLGRLRSVSAAGALARMIHSNRSAAADYPDPLEAARAGAEALTILMETSASEITDDDLQQVASVPDGTLSGGSGRSVSVDCSQLRDLAAGELARRKIGDVPLIGKWDVPDPRT